MRTMIDIPKNLLNRVKNGEPIEELETYLLNNYPIPAIIKAFAELIVTADDAVNRPQITVTQAEYEAIVGLFKVRGLRTVCGEVVKERRGRPRKEIPDAGENQYKLDM